ncbi:DNA-binding response regulator [Flavobacterium columnare NBRC 100251 = ATCC 23463]|uniref:LytTR family two component transcriptional regulator n=2 Tax=Flavobacterium columnare TaxID=996 RepID=G8X589_FLACA|nr:response regulator transcription factor [Flavobacterium columnare]AEW85500.1 LytTR family two component transcriptional regulator [Flavobacterium columnare ATCC 49512]AMO20100.1 response regulator transcription factor [Flavobacterium columnare]ANO49300.1 LytTR family two component transcriptional regulator [Flavobacterium columnare]APT22718.1 DNA-binding response regulator [Flavobacterium columnare]AUX18050.1 two-component system response regulator [Flavobacterium columnare]
MIKIKAVIVEDSRLARNELKELIKSFPEIEVLGEAENVDAAYELINSLNPDLLFLDINMPEKDGFELLEMLDDVPITVFTTAFDEYALKSFEYNALDYLMKPVSPNRFSKAIDKVKQKLENKIVKNKQKVEISNQIFIKEGEKCWLLKVADIYLFEVEGNYTKVFFNDQKAVLNKSLNQIEKKLPEDFFRANRNQIININYIKNIDLWFSGNLLVHLKDDQKIEISRRQSSLFKEKMSL